MAVSFDMSISKKGDGSWLLMLVGSSYSSMMVHPAPERSHKWLSRALAGLVGFYSSGGA